MRNSVACRSVAAAGAFLSGLTLAAPMAHAEFLSIEAGDIACVDYREESGDCASIQRARPLPDGSIALVDETRMKVGEISFSVASGFVARPEGGRLCVDPQTVKVRAMPASNPLAKEYALDLGVELKMLALGGACVEHRACGPDMVAEFFIDGKKARGGATRFRLFKKGDPVLKSLQPRIVGPAQLASISADRAFDCDQETHAITTEAQPSTPIRNSQAPQLSQEPQ